MKSLMETALDFSGRGLNVPSVRDERRGENPVVFSGRTVQVPTAGRFQGFLLPFVGACPSMRCQRIQLCS